MGKLIVFEGTDGSGKSTQFSLLTRRLQAREGERYANFAARWIPLEEAYFAQYNVEVKADFAIDTTPN